VDFGFLDYSTMDRREYYCHEELRLNRRFCPEIYIDVLPITETAGGVRVGSVGPPVEWTLRMRQLPEEDLLSRRLAGARVDAADIRRLANSIARIHRDARTSAEIRQAGSIEAITRNVEENFEQTRGRIGSALPAEHFEAVRRFADAALRDHLPRSPRSR
jgi:aminoglycoside phosphotransferase family enzyme